ncbi:serine hydrolase domain-containing protein [Tautonia sp. JC769]|uniref:serine hydrolase domain-containing protein n=1 Tax=Tautonia sp. JC769 TaxID=3232135 RepID=UPI003459ABEA
MSGVPLAVVMVTLFPTLPLRAEGPEEAAGNEARALAALLEPIRERHGLPALAGAIVTAEGPIAVGAVGLRRAGDGPAVSLDDRFHLGSCTKAMTATLLATFVEEGVISWQTTLAEALPDLARVMHPDYRSATLEQLLAHRAGFSGETAAPGLSLLAMKASSASLTAQRTDYLRRVLAEAPASRPGTTFEYSNRGYIVAGAIAERLGKAPWEDLMRRRLFEPLGMSSGGFGPMASPGRADQPWPHLVREGITLPIPPGPGADNPLMIGPAGTVHASMADWARFVACHLRAGEGRPALLAPETFATLHARPGDGNYAFGWGFHERSWGGGTVLNHAGSNTMNYAVVWMAPRRRFAVLAATNQAGDAGPKACDEASSALIQYYMENHAGK